MQDLLPHKKASRKSERKKIRRKKKIRGQNSRRSSARAVERHSLSVYSGTIWLGNDRTSMATNTPPRVSEEKRLAVTHPDGGCGRNVRHRGGGGLMTKLVRYEAALAALAEARSVEEVLEVGDQAAAKKALCPHGKDKRPKWSRARTAR